MAMGDKPPGMSWAEACARLDENYQRFQSEIEAGRMAEAEEYRQIYNDWLPYEPAKTEPEYWETMFSCE